eukprot:TRINITY_DN906_c0_g1::TRINITY_DN906_c0_g1_i1::g.15952::m.15952 TRINITY_DN906_c0_g1::TRINITY_DN906_c0_g1_i1::g.15952  ORF type:complete len:198 (+),score=1.65,sp/Q9CPY6/GID4_MOUSE/35.68/4e-29,Vac_ImportDeg/PF09783.4/1.4e-48 TRINITY_DN906_c0_g1_i1:100-693(+)
MVGAKLTNSSFFQLGQAFSGTQNVTHNLTWKEAWRVNVRLQGLDLRKAYICGSMEALNVPCANSSVITFWEGEIIDNQNFGFITGRWDATKEDDLNHWNKFRAFLPFYHSVSKDGGCNIDLSSCDHVFMRWKEKFFVNAGPDCGLTIAGFYYVCLERKTGKIDGYYFDPNSSPYQKLELQVSCESRQGHAFPSYSFN